MTTLSDLKDWVKTQIGVYPEYKEEIIDYWNLCRDEISEGASVQNEIYLCMESIKQLIAKNDED